MKRIAITGSNGFIGKHLVSFFETNNFEVFKLQRSSENKKNTFKWVLGNNLPKKVLDADVIIHCAHDNGPESLKNEIHKNINYIGLKKILLNLRSKPKYEFYFISSQSAHKYTKSYYGRLKFAMENLINFKEKDRFETIIRPGMVYGHNSYITLLIKEISKLKVIPFFSFDKNIQPIDISDLVNCIYKIVFQDISLKLNEYNLASYDALSFKEYVKFICKDNNLPYPFFIYIPKKLIIFFSKIVDLLKITKFSLTERLYGLIYLKKLNVNKSLQSINYKLVSRFTEKNDYRRNNKNS